MGGILVTAYILEAVKGERTWGYIGVFSAIILIPLLAEWVAYRSKPDSDEFRYYIVAGFMAMYVFCLITGNTNMVFCYVLPLLSYLVLYHQPKLIIGLGIGTIILNAITITVSVLNGEMTLADSREAEIQIAVLALCFAGCYSATKLYDEIMRKNQEYLDMVDEKNKQLRDVTIRSIMTISNTMDAKDDYTQGHSERVAEYSAIIAQRMGIPKEQIENIHSVALLHDIGKIGVPDSVLNKTGRLTDDEFSKMKQHTTMGSQILEDIGNILPEISIGATYHHERYDGTGYPQGLKGEEIPFIARLIAVADAYDAMTSDRCYRNRMTHEQVMNELIMGEGKQFDPKIVRTLIQILEEKSAK